ncbi:MAG: response regulator transcription factor [Chloroflexi bacterium OHK40]
MDETTIDVVVVDDHPVFRRGLRAILEEPGTPKVRLMAEAATAEEALALVAEHVPDVLLADLKLGELETGLELIRQVRRTSPQTGVLVITGFDEADQLLRAIQAGASGCISKADQLDSTEIRRALVEIARGGRFSSTIVLRRLHDMLQQGVAPTIVEPLTPREQEVLALIAAGATNQEIADRLVVSIKTVKTHVSNILSKLQLQSRYEAAIYYRSRAPGLS